MHIYTTGHFNTTRAPLSPGGEGSGLRPHPCWHLGASLSQCPNTRRKHTYGKKDKTPQVQIKTGLTEAAEKAGGLPIRPAVVLPEGEVT